MAQIDYIITKQTDPFSRWFGYGQTQDHTYPFWVQPHQKVITTGSKTQTQTGVTISEGLELCVEISSAAGGSYNWDGKIDVDSTTIASTSGLNRTNMLLIYFKWGTWHTFEGHPNDWDAEKDIIDSSPPARHSPIPKPRYFNDFSSKNIAY